MVVASRKVTIAGLGDLHAAEESRHPFGALFAEIGGCADILALCGDLTNLGTPEEAAFLARALHACRIPMVGVLGNHDLESGQGEEVARILRAAGVHLLEDHPCEIQGVGFAGVKGFVGGFGRHMLASFGEGAVKRFVAESVAEALHLENALRMLATERNVAVLHYAPIVDTVVGEPREIYPFLGSSRLEEAVDRYKVSAVLHGHAHHGAYRGRTARGIPVYNCAWGVPKDGGRPYALVDV